MTGMGKRIYADVDDDKTTIKKPIDDEAEEEKVENLDANTTADASAEKEPIDMDALLGGNDDVEEEDAIDHEIPEGMTPVWPPQDEMTIEFPDPTNPAMMVVE